MPDQPYRTGTFQIDIYYAASMAITESNQLL
jgi:hypothetical protein